MKKLIFSLLLASQTIISFAQTDAKPFKGYIYNKEYEVYIQMDFYTQKIIVPGQEILGEVAGYFGDKHDGRKWLFTSADVKGKSAHLAITNDYGSEDLEASLTQTSDSTFELKQLEGSTLKIARNRKWVKMPKSLIFQRK
jgi:hypothetical protein